MKNELKVALAAVAAILALIVATITWTGFVGHNDYQDYQVYQSAGGTVEIIDHPGYYPKLFGTTWTYPRVMEVSYNKADLIKATFNDGGIAMVSTYARIELPLTQEQRLKLHQQFNGNPENIKAAVRAHLENCVKTGSPIMSASENQASRKGEFNQIIEEQLSQGLFKTRRTTIELDDLSTIEEVGVTEKGEKITKEKKARVQATEIVVGTDGKPIVIQDSPLKIYGLKFLQFSITDIEYDPTTLEQFAAKKKSYLAAEQAKAERQQEVQQRLMIEERGRRQVADVQAEENQKKERALIQAQQAAEVAVITKDQAVTAAKQKTEVANQLKVEAETLREIAAIDAQKAELLKNAKISEAQGQQKVIELGGGLSEKERILAEIHARRDAEVAKNIAGIATPQVMIMPGASAGPDGQAAASGQITEHLINLALLKSFGILKDTK